MKNLTLRNLTKVCNGIWHGDNALLDQEISAITTDSRKIEKDCLFVPIVGETFPMNVRRAMCDEARSQIGT